MKSQDIKNTSAIVEAVLRLDPDARNSDNYLYYAVCRQIGARKGIDIDKMPFPKVILNLKEYGMPPYETVRRTRQKLQAEHDELAPAKAVRDAREANERVFKRFALE